MATARRDTLLELQAKAQKKWADEKTFEVTAPRDGASPLDPSPARAIASEIGRSGANRHLLRRASIVRAAFTSGVSDPSWLRSRASHLRLQAPQVLR